MNDNPLTCILTTPNLDATGHRWMGMLASIEFTLEYQKGADNGVPDALSQVPICHDCQTVSSLLEGARVGAADRGEAEASEELLCEHVHLENEVHVQAVKLAPMHVVDWGEAQEVNTVLATFRRWLCAYKDTPFPKKNALLKKYFGDHAETEEGCGLFRVCNSLVLNKRLLYVSTMPKGDAEGILAFLIPTGQHCTTLNGVHCDAGHQGQQWMLDLTQECFWWPMMVVDCHTLVQGCQQCRIFEGAILVHIDLMSLESTMQLNKPPSVKNVLVITDHIMHYALVVVMSNQTAKTVARVLYEWFIVVFGAPAKLLSNCRANFTSTLVEELCAMFGIQKCHITAYHTQCYGQVEHFNQTLF